MPTSSYGPLSSAPSSSVNHLACSTSDAASEKPLPSSSSGLLEDERSHHRMLRITVTAVIVAVAACCGTVASLVMCHAPSAGGGGSGAASVLLPESIAYRVPLVMQTTDYWCGAASAASVLAAFGIVNVTQETLAAEMHTSPGWGSDWSRIVNATVSRGLDVRVGQNMTIRDIQHHLVHHRALVIVDYMAWCGPPWGCESKYATDTVDGHYSVVVGYNQSGMLLMDPYMLFGSGRVSYGFVNFDGWDARWHDTDSQYQNLVVRLGIAVFRSRSNPTSSSGSALLEPDVMQWPEAADIQYTM